MNEELTRVVFEAFHGFWKAKEDDHDYVPFDEMDERYPASIEVWSKVGESAIQWYLKNRERLHGAK